MKSMTATFRMKTTDGSMNSLENLNPQPNSVKQDSKLNKTNSQPQLVKLSLEGCFQNQT
jgi:hypothetical protein